ncbi:AraC family ethanolamine operon transcriptional activator [Peteryoungia aggregata LMG 23059]|uniref:AraC family ethanolamine operon transcriptional activator n=1 Tax=Peteryoungia aggregata LMG 23059 TaxID=1368425 RepID=A0ABU0G321_9HYPH|nr:helix-turn-helix domain-containing protein [Peteryoungia aggregata]MDQ0419731.1 AraC family ethanolamine operon transcriptional activator [Peteryoungia aggregata LMG 23059]
MSDQIRHSDGLFHERSFDDIDRQAAELSGYDQSYRQMSKGRFSGRFSSLVLPGHEGVHIERVNQVIEQTAAVPRGQIAALFLLSGQALCRLGSLDFAMGDMALFGEGAEIQFRNALDTVVCVVSLSVDRLVGRWPEGDQRLGQGGSLMVRQGRSPIPGIVATAARTMEDGRQRGDLKAAPLIDRLGLRLEDEVQKLLSGEPPNKQDPAGAPPHRRVFAQAMRIVETNLDRDLPVSRLASDVGVSRRALEYAFHEAVGLGPAHYIQRRRLNAVRQALSGEGPVTIGDVTARFGIWHLSRFASQYRDLFGELPSETLRRTHR